MQYLAPVTVYDSVGRLCLHLIQQRKNEPNVYEELVVWQTLLMIFFSFYLRSCVTVLIVLCFSQCI